MSQATIDTEIESAEGDSQTFRCRRLWAAVLLQAVRDYGSVKRDKVPAPGSAYGFNPVRLQSWFLSTSREVKSFEWICELLDIDPDVMRIKLEVNSQVITGVRK
jgi:hypothetical protein